MEAFVKPHAPPKGLGFASVISADKSVALLVNVRNAKSKELEPRLLFVDAHRVYLFFKGGKEELHFHMLEILDMTSLGKSALTITYQLLADKMPNVLELCVLSLCSTCPLCCC